MKKKILTTLILIAFCLLLLGQSVKAETEVRTTIQIKKGATSWTSISVSDAYDKCQELNDDNSALGITSSNVMAHLSTNADWYAVSLLTQSDYGSKNNNNTTGNNSGIMNFGKMWTFTAGIMEDNTQTTNANYQSIIDNKNTKFVEKIKNQANKESNKPGLGFRASELLSSDTIYYQNNFNAGPISVRMGLYSFAVGQPDNWNGNSGGRKSNVTFRPVIWVK